MNNVISKSQSLFLVAILAICPSANAITNDDAKYIQEELQKVYHNVNEKRKLLQENYEAFKLKIEEGLGGAVINENTPLLIKTIAANIKSLTTDFLEIQKNIVSFNDRLAKLEQGQDAIKLEMSELFKNDNNRHAPEQQNPGNIVMDRAAPEQNMVNELNRAPNMNNAANPTVIDSLQTHIAKYRADYLSSGGKENQTELTRKFIDNISGLKRSNNIKLEKLANLVNQGNFSQEALEAIKALEVS